MSQAARLKRIIEKDDAKAAEVVDELKEIDNALDTILFDIEGT